MSKGIVLVPTDFSEVGNCALEHGAVIAKSSNRSLIALHIVGKSSEAESSKSKIEKIASDVAEKYGIPAQGIVRIGNIFEDIGDTAVELGAKFVIMGTHGMKGMQRIIGSHAMKVITNSTVPFIIVQKKGIDSSGYENIVLPIDLEKETKQKLSYAAEIAEHFNSRIHLFFQKETDEYLKNKLKSNLIFAKKYLTERNVSFSTNIAEGERDFDEEIIDFAVSHDADLIGIMNTQDSFLENLLGSGSSEQQLITNEAQIPVLILNATQVSSGGGMGFNS